ncbi:MAG TPA: hypothetical protein VFI38_13375 [Candidatus Acidoferrum sp.]|nr:hypothetical protein [Candidatus Acidoferrum sp.]
MGAGGVYYDPRANSGYTGPVYYSTPPADAPGAPVPPPAPAANAPDCQCPADLIPFIQYKTWKGVPVTSRNAWVLSDTVRAGYFWWVMFAAALYTEASTRHLALHLIPPGFGPTQTGNADDSFFVVAANKPPTAGSLRVTSPGFLVSDTQSSASSQVNLNPSGPVIVPPGWTLMAWEEEITTGSPTLHAVELRAAFLELPIGTIPPSVG